MSGFGLLDYLTICLAILFLWGIRPNKNIVTGQNYLAKDKMLAARGIAVMIPLLSHIYSSGANGGQFILKMSDHSELAPCMFFIISGYGLMKQNMLKDNYSKGFLLKRFPKVLVPYIMATLAFVAANFVFNGFLYGPVDVIHAILCGDPIVSYSWYVIHILLFYIWFFILMKIFRKRKGLIIAGGVAYYVLSTVAFMRLGFGMHWWGTSFGLVVGMIFAVYEKQIFDLFHKGFYIKLVCYLVLLVLVYLSAGPYYRITGFGDKFPYHTVFDLMCCIGVFILLVGFEIGNPVSRFLGKYSYEIYLLQGLFILAGRSSRLQLEGNAYIILVVLGAVVSGVVLYYVDSFILSLFKRK